MLAALERRVNLQAGQTVVVDRGMAYQENLAQLKSRGLHYVVAGRQGEREQWLSEIEDGSGFAEVVRHPSPLNPFQKKSRIEVKLLRKEGETYVLCLSDGRQAKDRAIREKAEQKLLADVAKLSRRISSGRLKKADKIYEALGRLKERYPRVARYYNFFYEAETGELRSELDGERRGRAERLDGSYVLKTDRADLEAEEIWLIYSLLTRAERAFRDMKSPLIERPIYHQVEKRVDTHIFLCVLAYHLLVSIEKTLLDKGEHTSWATVRDHLKSHQVCTITLPTTTGEVLEIRKGSAPEPEHKRLYDLLEVSHQLMLPRKTWRDTEAGQ